MSEWRSVLSWEGLYEVSDSGEVRSLPRIVVKGDGKTQAVAGRVLRQVTNTHGYLVVTLSDQSCDRLRQERVHRLVGLAFVDNPHGYPEINHLDGVKTNNAKCNLEWTTPLGNQRHARKNGLWRQGLIKYGTSNVRARLNDHIVLDIRSAHARGESAGSLARRFGVGKDAILSVVHGRTWRHVGVSLKSPAETMRAHLDTFGK